MPDNAGRDMQRLIREAIIKNKAARGAWVKHMWASEMFGVGEVRHDPPWHLTQGAWKGPSEVARGEFHHNVSLCGKELGRVMKREPKSDDDICGDCIAGASVILEEYGW